MILNSKQLKVLIVSVVIFLGTGLYPPWTNTFNYRSLRVAQPAGYAFILSPPKPPHSYWGVRLDIRRLVVQWFVLVVTTSAALWLMKSSNNAKEGKLKPGSKTGAAERAETTAMQKARTPAKQKVKAESYAGPEWELRTLCADANCIGIIGEDGRCTECGRTPKEIREEEALRRVKARRYNKGEK